MINLKQNGYTYGSSYGDTSLWKLDKTGEGIYIDILAPKIELNYIVSNNTYMYIDAKYISKTEFLKQYRKIQKLIKEQIKL